MTTKRRIEEGLTSISESETGTSLITAERFRQINEEGWTAEHDAEHSAGELGYAAIAYLVNHYAPSYTGSPPGWWPWEREWWKPSDDPVRNLVKAGALIAAEIDRLQRIAEEDS